MYYYQRLRDLREDRDKKQKEIAEYLGIAQGQYQRYESGYRQIPFHMVILLAKYYNVSIDYIAGLTNEKQGLTKSSLSSADTKLLRGFHKLNKPGQIRMLERLDALMENYTEK